VPLSPDTVTAELDVKLQTPTSSQPPSRKTSVWALRTPNNSTEAILQPELRKFLFSGHQDSPPTSICKGIDQIAKEAKQIIYKMTLLQAEVAELRGANSLIRKRRRAKRVRIWLGGSFKIQDAEDLKDQNDVAQQVQQELCKNGGGLGCG